MKSFDFVVPGFFFIVVTLAAGITKAQTSGTLSSETNPKKSDAEMGIRYTSDYLYMGRSDSAKAPYLSLLAGYYHKSGLFIDGSLSYLTAAGEGRIDLYRLSGGYDHYGRQLVWGVSVSEYFFNDLSYVVQAAMNTYLNAYAGYDFSLFMIYAEVNTGFSESTEVFSGFELNRTFYTLKDKIRIKPAFYINAGSQEYYQEYYNRESIISRSQKGNGKGGASQHSLTPQNVEISESSKFQVLDYEIGLRVNYKKEKFRIHISGVWTFPVNPSTITTDQYTYQEELNNGFFWSSGARFTF